MDRRKTDRRPTATDGINIPDIFDIIQILYKRKTLIAPIIIAPIILCILYLSIKPNVYRAKTSVILESQNLNLVDFQDILAGNKFDNLTVPTQVEVIASPTLARETLASLSMQNSTQDENAIGAETEPSAEDIAAVPYADLKKFMQNLHVDQQGTSRIIEISFDSTSAQDAANKVNAHTKNYVFSQIRAKKEQAARLNDWISTQIVTLKKESLKKSREVQKFKSENGMVQGLNSQDLIYQQISDIAKQLSPIETRELDLQARVERLKNGKSGDTKDVIDSQLIQSLKARASTASQDLQALLADYGDNHPEVISARKQITQINADIRREISNIEHSIKNELTTIIQQKALLKEKLQELQSNADSLQEKQITLQALQLEESASHKLLDNFLARSEEINSQLDFTRPDVRIISFADTPGEPKGSKKALILIAVTFLATFFAFGVVFLLEIIDSGIHNKDDVKKVLNLKLLGTLPIENNPLGCILSKDRSEYVEEIKRVYIHLCAQNNAQTLLFTSTKKGEGKSVTAVALAYYLNSIGKKTILIDASTSLPKIARITQVPSSPGFYELMAGTHGLKDVITTNETHLSIIPSGEENSFSSDLLVSGRFTEQLEKIKKSYEYIIIDSASALDASDANILARLVDQTIIVVAWNNTPKNNVQNVAESLRELSPNTPNVILNKIPMNDLKKT